MRDYPKMCIRDSYHNENPFALTQECNGWADRRCIDYYLNFCRVLFERYKDVVKYWIPFNESNCLTDVYKRQTSSRS